MKGFKKTIACILTGFILIMTAVPVSAADTMCYVSRPTIMILWDLQRLRQATLKHMVTRRVRRRIPSIKSTVHGR